MYLHKVIISTVTTLVSILLQCLAFYFSADISNHKGNLIPSKPAVIGTTQNNNKRLEKSAICRGTSFIIIISVDLQSPLFNTRIATMAAMYIVLA